MPAHSQRALFSDGGSRLTCSAIDGTGAALPLRRVTGTFTFNEWQAVFRFETGDGEVTLDCSQPGGSAQVRVGELPSTTTFVLGLLVAILGPVVLGLTGGVILVITFIRYLSRPPVRAADEQPPPGTDESTSPGRSSPGTRPARPPRSPLHRGSPRAPARPG